MSGTKNPESTSEEDGPWMETEDGYVSGLMRWHFSPATGSPFWLSLARKLNFDPIREVHSFADLVRFDDVSHLLRRVRPADLAPRGCRRFGAARVYESGGTTGPPKYVLGYEQWFRKLAEWRVGSMTNLGAGNTLGVVPSGPHMVHDINMHRAEVIGGKYFTVDIDPRWVRRILLAGRDDVAADYISHVLAQIRNALTMNEIEYLVTTPPLLDALLSRGQVMDELKRLKRVTLGGTHVDPALVTLLRSEYGLPAEIVASYGSTSVLGESGSQPILEDVDHIVYESFFPSIIYDVVDELGRGVSPGKVGRVCATHLSKYAFFPRVMERDTALLVSREPSGMAVIADISNGSNVGVEGVY